MRPLVIECGNSHCATARAANVGVTRRGERVTIIRACDPTHVEELFPAVMSPAVAFEFRERESEKPCRACTQAALLAEPETRRAQLKQDRDRLFGLE